MGSLRELVSFLLVILLSACSGEISRTHASKEAQLQGDFVVEAAEGPLAKINIGTRYRFEEGQMELERGGKMQEMEYRISGDSLLTFTRGLRGKALKMAFVPDGRVRLADLSTGQVFYLRRVPDTQTD